MPPWWFQVYVMDDRTLTTAVVQRAAAAGASALILTVDAPGTDPSKPQARTTDVGRAVRHAGEPPQHHRPEPLHGEPAACPWTTSAG